ncbi:hypothetical protein NFHSH190041_14980 [Shewanella sp. NFH-SH190041]|uniref:c-type cytochrome n=1 Tax=Shewanella sp. NFH-SH190041 TaxID=2950245 RepID=UPI0021C38057|nr:c-type cytochrome [Shewanella sp. NFH-SH190041]BDM64046.1 hypothetical protein NFHSH190041_14980 [Shewanella sp. NFH-SH190041]
MIKQFTKGSRQAWLSKLAVCGLLLWLGNVLPAVAAPLAHNQFNQALIKLDLTLPETLLSHQADVAKGKILAQTRCEACHGSAMLKLMPQYPALAGQQPAYLVKQLLSFQTAARVNPIMQAQATGLTMAQIKDVALWYASQPRVALQP